MSEFLGIYKGSVLNSDDPENRGRSTLLIPQVLADQPSSWAEPIIETSHRHKPGDVVWVQFLEGDPSRPVYQSRGGMVQTFYSDEKPTGLFQIGDLWFDTNDDNHRYEWDGVDWSEAIHDINATEINRGDLDPSLIKVGPVSFIPEAQQQVMASEALSAGDLVNVWDDDGDFKVRRALAAVTLGDIRRAHGFVTSDAGPGDMVTVRLTGHNNHVSGLIPGTQFLGIDGSLSPTPPSTAGNIVQSVGFAVTPTVLSFQPFIPVVLT